MVVNECLFCKDEFYEKGNLIYENTFWKCVYDGFPISKGHVLIIVKRHCESFFKLTIFELLSLIVILFKIKKILDNNYNPNGYNIGVNDGECAGQTIHHLHIHLIPRYYNDGGLPCGIRNIFPREIANYVNIINGL